MLVSAGHSLCMVNRCFFTTVQLAIATVVLVGCLHVGYCQNKHVKTKIKATNV